VGEKPVPHTTEATYENGVLKLVRPLPLKEHERVRVIVETLAPGDHSILDIEPVHLGEVLAPFSKNDDLLGDMLEGR
jgi:predicted DNA-binding antitoxin AbrB/MazE fold protein